MDTVEVEVELQLRLQLEFERLAGTYRSAALQPGSESIRRVAIICGLHARSRRYIT